MLINVAGVGKVTSALLFNLKDKVEIGYVLSRNKRKAEKLCEEMGQGTPVDYNDSFKFEGILFVGYPDSILPEASSILKKYVNEKTIEVIHFSGYFSSNIFPTNWNPASVHPNCPVLGKETNLKNVVFGIEGNLEVAKKIVSLLGGEYFIIPPESKTYYHLAAVLISNFSLALAYLSEKLYEQGKISKEKFSRVVESLLNNMVENIKKNGTVESITGPIARKDYNIVRKERELFCKTFPEYCGLYDKFIHIILSMKEKK
ncbi:DUF2520 domain-containing protein [Thermosipho atlanticus]|uniref:Predicted oxidoreductase, contains short-chain dehydrogenase (SDR) and DUF2520 domains n=1 Tax=Thermosipho atlanticus DSM 15807 TaxID=1123380 RepID=A0A1M5QM26_9BACT|nr:DUF2520 domain-containing protein [Thermosipho atlanticus]SHH15175.1 Predicted oxidoreductase, contains short-chain dehydrogenase (SDR) and DUF2520 domains [Thermosipho atlanticus DSM 15807]